MNDKEKFELLDYLEYKSDEECLEENDIIMLSKLSYDEDDYIRANVARILVNLNDEKSEEILMRLAYDNDSLVRTEACDSFCLSKSLTIYEKLKHIARTDRNGMVRGYAISSLGDIAFRIDKQNDLVKFLESQLVNEKVEFTKINIYTVLYSLGDNDYLDKLLATINTKRYQNRCAVVNNLFEVVDECNKERIHTTLLERKKIEKSGAVISTINEVIQEMKIWRKL